MQKEEIKFADSTIFEGMTSIRAILRGIEAKTNDRPLEKILFDPSRIKKIGKDLGYLKAISEKIGFEIHESSAEELDKLTLGSSHGGLIAIAGKRSLPRLTQNQIEKNGFYAMIDGIEDPYNFGYTIRSLYAMGCSGLILAERNWMSAAGVVCRSSAGASEQIPIYVSEPEEAATIFKKLKYSIVCADERTDNILGRCEMKLPLLLIVGGEKRGISRSVLDKADLLVKIEYGREFRASLSAASAATMFAYEIARQNDIKLPKDKNI
jgi:23S rRNA (guanosine2251-2'-O)-methyltransferase